MEFKTERMKRIKELKYQGHGEEATVQKMKAEYPFSTKSYWAEKKLHEIYKEA